MRWLLTGYRLAGYVVGPQGARLRTWAGILVDDHADGAEVWRCDHQHWTPANAKLCALENVRHEMDAAPLGVSVA